MDDFKKKLTPEQFEICRLGGTERPFSGKYYDHHETGTYHCIACGQSVFRSDEKYDSGSGWPSYWQPVSTDAVRLLVDTSHSMVRTEVRCSRCDSHLGHVFDDGPLPTGKRFCINSASLDFHPTK